MHINNPDALKTWLTEVLEPLCDADPAALARYVLALLKKDKPEKDLRDCMKEQLDVFLGAETEPFLEQLFRSIKSEEYIKVVQAKEAAAAATAAAAAAAAAATAAAAAAAQQSSPAPTEPATTHTSSTATTTSSSSSTSSKVRIKREFTPPLHESKPSKESLAAGVSTTVSSSSGSSTSNSHENNGSELMSSSASSGAISASNQDKVSSGSEKATAAVSNSSNSKSTPPVKSSSKEDHVSKSKESSRSSRAGGRRISNRSRSRSRSRSFERVSRRSRSRDRGPTRDSSNRDKSNRPYRNKSPVGSSRGSSSRYERKNHGSSSSNNYESRRGGATGGSRGTIRSQSRSRSPSPMADRRKMARSESPAVAAAAAAAVVAAPALEPVVELGGKRQRCRDFDEKGYCMRGETCPWDHGVDPVVLEDINNPALITIQSAAQLRAGPIHPEYSPDAPELWNRPPNFPPGRPSITQRLGNIGGVGGVGGGFGPRGAMAGGNFRSVAPGFPPGFVGNPVGATPLQRELISVPVVDANKGGDVSSQQTKRRFEPEDAVAIADGHLKRKLPLNNRLGPRVTGHPAGAGGAVNPQQNCSLELRKIPRGLNAIAHLNNHFSKFGKIVNIQISYDGDPEAAIVTFSTHAEANVAYRSTEAVLNNRFIKVFWHTAGSGEQPAITPAAKTEHSLRRSYPNQYSINNNLNAVTTAAGNTPTTVTPAASKENAVVASSSAAIVSSGGENVAPATTAVATGFTNTATKLINTVTTPIVTANQLRMKNAKINRATTELLRKKQELTQTMHKGKYDLMQGYLKELSKLIMMVEKYEATDPMRTKLLAPIKDLEAKIASLKAEISTEQSQIAATLMPKRKTKEQHEKEILDAELEIIAAEQRTHRIPGVGGAPQPASGPISGTLPTNKPQLSGPRPVRPLNRPLGSTSVDRRPTTISITGFAAEDADALLGHFKNFGEITKHQLDKTVPSLLISYSIRQNAEKALVRGKSFRDVTLQITWVATPPPASTPIITPAAESKAVVEKDAAAKEGADASGKVSAAIEGTTVAAVDATSAASLDTLTETGSMEEAAEVRMVEEEEEEEEEDRSWRR